MGKQELENREAASLQDDYEKQQQELAKALLSGATWEEVREQRINVTKLSHMLYKALSSHPASLPRDQSR